MQAETRVKASVMLVAFVSFVTWRRPIGVPGICGISCGTWSTLHRYCGMSGATGMMLRGVSPLVGMFSSIWPPPISSSAVTVRKMRLLPTLGGRGRVGVRVLVSSSKRG